MQGAIGLALCVILIIVVVDDLKNFTIRNATVVALVGLFALKSVAVDGKGQFWEHAAFGGAVFGLLLLAYVAKLAGGGDVKLLTAAFLWFGLPCSATFSITLVLTTLSYSLCARIGLMPMRKSDQGAIIPFGPSIAAAWALTQFYLC